MMWVMIGAPLGLLAMLLLIGILGAALVLGGDTALAGVSVAGIPVGGLDEEAAAAAISQTWEGRGVLLRDGVEVYPVQPALLGILLDAPTSAQRAVEYRRDGGIGGLMRAAFDEVMLPPVISLDREAFARGLAEIAPQIDRPAQNAGVEFVGGSLQARPAREGRTIDIGATLAQLEAQGTQALRDGTLDLVMLSIPPEMTDSAPVLAAAQSLLASPFDITLFNPVRNTSNVLQVFPEIWAGWLTATSDAAQPSGLALTFDTTALRGYLESQGAALDTNEYLNMDETLTAINNAIARSETRAQVRVYNRDATHIVQAGDTITSIAWDYGVPYLYIQQANGGLADGLSVGERITIPSVDNFLELPVVPNKRIVVSIGEQRVRVYEDGALKWDWIASTGIASSPTWTGIYQIISHEPNAYAGNWDLWMPDFMGVYRPIPGADFTNGFHGFPTRGGSQLLWTNSLGTRVTYGCILLSNENIRLLYDWAEQGVVVEIRA
jgi:LysM repeat protein